MSEHEEEEQSSKKWRVGHVGRHSMYYEELRNGRWERLELDGEMLMGRAHHIIYFGNCEDWKRRPDWALGRRDEIIDRIKGAFRIPDYEYNGEAVLSDSDAVLLVEAAGGLSEEPCRWANCPRAALRGKAVCIYHSVQQDQWRESAAQQGVERDGRCAPAR